MLQTFQKETLLELAKNGGFKFTDKWFPYTSGWIGPCYVQSMDVCKTAVGFAGAIHGIMSIVEQIIRDSDQAIDIISGGESRDWPFSFPVAEKLGVAPLMIYKDGKMLGADVKNKKVLHVADLNNEGSSPRDKWIPAIRGAGGTITDIVFYVDRLEDGAEEMKKLGLNAHAVISLNEDAWNFLKEEGFITEEILSSLLDYWKDRKAWGAKKLMEYPTILTKILDEDPRKGMKIFNTFYPLIGNKLPETFGFESKEKFENFFEPKLNSLLWTNKNCLHK